MSFQNFAIFAPLLVVVFFGLLGWFSFWKKQERAKEASLIIFSLAFIVSTGLNYFFKGLLAPSLRKPAFAVFFSEDVGHLWFLLGLAFLEEFIKAFAIIKAFESVSKRVLKSEDGVFPGVAAAMGLLFTEALLYTHTIAATPEHFSTWIFCTFSAQIIASVIFAIYYTNAYTNRNLIRDDDHLKQSPITALGNISQIAFNSLPVEKRTFWRVYWASLKECCKLLRLHITFRHVLLGRPVHKGHWSGEVVIEGFLLAFYLHFTYLLLNTFAGPEVCGAFLLFFVCFFVLLFFRFLCCQKIPLPTQEEKK